MKSLFIAVITLSAAAIAAAQSNQPRQQTRPQARQSVHQAQPRQQSQQSAHQPQRQQAQPVRQTQTHEQPRAVDQERGRETRPHSYRAEGRERCRAGYPDSYGYQNYDCQDYGYYPSNEGCYPYAGLPVIYADSVDGIVWQPWMTEVIVMTPVYENIIIGGRVCRHFHHYVRHDVRRR